MYEALGQTLAPEGKNGQNKTKCVCHTPIIRLGGSKFKTSLSYRKSCLKVAGAEMTSQSVSKFPCARSSWELLFAESASQSCISSQ